MTNLVDVSANPLNVVVQLYRGVGNNRPMSTATASSFLNAAGRLGG